MISSLAKYCMNYEGEIYSGYYGKIQSEPYIGLANPFPMEGLANYIRAKAAKAST